MDLGGVQEYVRSGQLELIGDESGCRSDEATGLCL
jgi:hypothetical protein